ncbi:hypothetical protein Tcan_09086 [Toxocara canis]|uniref:Uncharacterized protein n=1 Tax=Toxocara canis TaxID=6265 RepID=A0A0B2VBA2_TOXCA|nr:hypothetical protein Tcan_09086 [Toxocara canis]
MLGMMNSSSEGIDLYSEPSIAEPIFERKGSKPQVTYMKDGRKLLNGEVETTQEPELMWNNLITKSVVRKIHLVKMNNEKEGAEPQECDPIVNCAETSQRVEKAGKVDDGVQSQQDTLPADNEALQL